jgi:hypothetical protein
LLYELLTVRYMGVPKQLVLDVLGHAYLSAGPRHVELFGRLHPRAYKAQHIRYEKSVGQLMPAQLVPC